jgi:exodeoxyribonuclease V alpha subunit
VGKPQPERENLAGLVERVTFHNEDSGFCVLRVKARGGRDLDHRCRRAATISAGEFVHASAHWVNDRAHGVQFRAATNHFGSANSALASMSTAFCAIRCLL